MPSSTEHETREQPSGAVPTDAASRAGDAPSAATDEPLAPTQPVIPPDSYGPGSRMILASVVAGLVALPSAWLLSYGASLPFFLGLFFFPLFGLLISAVAVRVAAPLRPYRTAPVLAGTTLLVFIGWGGALFVEARDFPADVGDEMLEKTYDLGGRTPEQFKADVAEQVRGYLKRVSPPGGVLGYIRWTLTAGRIPAGELPDVGRTPGTPLVRGFWWAFRVVASLALFAFGIASQTFALRHVTDPASSWLNDDDD